MKRLFNEDWSFRKVLPDGASTEWNAVDIPHDWHIYDCNNLYEDGEGWYRKFFDHDVSCGERIYIRFDGVYMDTTVWVNDKPVGEWKYGYSTFEFEITGFLHNGKNEIRVRTVFKNPNSRWYSGAGIYRNVWFITKPVSHIVSDGVYISTRDQGDGLWSIDVSTETDIAASDREKDIYISYKVYDAEGGFVCGGFYRHFEYFARQTVSLQYTGENRGGRRGGGQSDGAVRRGE